ncbi:Phospholipase A1 [Heracleum sosnowskyi]|uniref:Phospholipase A1 n=1 Tax=Heracleum sosnowskyi TaxID=360622 RepID=A0AAD8J4N5_9APIA|nr:Phospholipase A1 [Heracleum sosnowskyi]
MTTQTQTEPSWLELMGSKDWQGLLDPLDLSLRHLILRCGDFCQATYDAFNNDQNSKYCGSSRYGKKDFFEKVMLTNASQYQVSCFLYATAKVTTGQAFLLHSRSREAWDRESNWIGYVATTTDEASAALGRREIYVAWRGTTRDYEWINVFDPKPASAKPLLNQKTLQLSANTASSSSDEDDDLPKVMQGWLTIYNSDDPKSEFTKLSARAQLMSKMKELLEKYKGEKVSITFAGHSLGASLSVVSAFDLAENGITDIPISAFIFGSPQVGDKRFNDRLKKFSNVKILHIRNKIDLIPLYPSVLLGYVNTGIELFIETRKSRNLKDTKSPSDWHNLQAMLHIVDGWNGDKGEFELKVKRSLALVNKSSEILKEEYLIPGSWWVEKNRGLVCDDKGEWVFAPPAEEDLPVPEF